MPKIVECGRKIVVTVSDDWVNIEDVMSDIVNVLSRHGGGTVAHEMKWIAQRLYQSKDHSADKAQVP
jgi:hypothetical protein